MPAKLPENKRWAEIRYNPPRIVFFPLFRQPETMKLDTYSRIGPRDDPDSGRYLGSLLAQTRIWLDLDRQVKALLPANLHPHMQAVCIEGGVLIVHASAAMAANRLKMILPALLPQLMRQCPEVRAVRVKMQPKNVPPQKEKDFRISAEAVAYFRASAEKLRHHPELAAALQRLADNQEQD